MPCRGMFTLAGESGGFYSRTMTNEDDKEG